MQELPHYYAVAAYAETAGDVALDSNRLPALPTATPPEFGGPGDRWSPETLLVGSLVDCFALTFRGVSRASNLQWIELRCEASGTLDRVDGLMQFTDFEIQAYVQLPVGGNIDLAQRVLEKAERTCLVANSLKAPVRLKVVTSFLDRSATSARQFPGPATVQR